MRRLFVTYCLAAALSVATVAACGTDPGGGGEDAGTHDAGLHSDAGRKDAGTDSGLEEDAGEDAGPDDAGESDGGVEDAGSIDAGVDAGFDAGRPVTFSQDVQPIFDAKCVSCHATQADGGQGQGNLELTSDRSWAELVDVNATWSTCSSLKRVSPASTMTSLMYLKVSGMQGMCGSSMPQGSTLPQAELKIISTWINAGAPKN